VFQILESGEEGNTLIQQDYGDTDKAWNSTLTDSPEFECMMQFHLEPYPVLQAEEGNVFCNRSWDTLMCWPTTPAGSLVDLPCFEELNGIKYDTSREYNQTCVTVVVTKRI
jgi:hypothetical protein